MTPLIPPVRRRRHRRYLLRATSWCAARTGGEELDRMIAEGADPDALGADPSSRPRCEARARLLVRRSFRLALVTEFEDVLAHAAGATGADRPPSPVWAVDIDFDWVRAADMPLRLIVAGLRAEKPPRAQGVALALLLLRDGRSPLYRGQASGGLTSAAELAGRALTVPVAPRSLR
jgi:hypothetical protein